MNSFAHELLLIGLAFLLGFIAVFMWQRYLERMRAIWKGDSDKRSET